MAWTKTEQGNLRRVATETKTLPASATIGYSSVIDFMAPGSQPNRYVSVLAVASAVSGTNLDIAIYGAMTPTGTKFLLKDAVVTDLTNGVHYGGVIDLNAYPAPYYFISWTADADESANTITVSVYY